MNDKPTKGEMLDWFDRNVPMVRVWSAEGRAIKDAIRSLIEKYGDGGPTEEERILRQLLWIRHGCCINALYRDDGEMQCGQCIIDFKRDSAKEISDRFTKLGMEKFYKESEKGE